MGQQVFHEIRLGAKHLLGTIRQVRPLVYQSQHDMLMLADRFCLQWRQQVGQQTPLPVKCLGPGCKASPHWGYWTQTLTRGCARTFLWDIFARIDVHAAGVSANGQCRMADVHAQLAGRYTSTLAIFVPQAQRRDVANSLLLYIPLRQASVGTANLAAVWLHVQRL